MHNFALFLYSEIISLVKQDIQNRETLLKDLLILIVDQQILNLFEISGF